MNLFKLLTYIIVAGVAFFAGAYSPLGKSVGTPAILEQPVIAPLVKNTQLASTEIVKSTAPAENREPGISLQSNSWGVGNPPDILKILNSAKDVLDKAFQSGAKNELWVYQNRARGYPITLYEKGPQGQYKIEITSTDRYWSNYAYQFSHEYCHVRTNYETPTTKAMWFDEVIGEMCSLYAIRRMSEEWEVNPPYENWRSYAGSLMQYTDDIINQKENQLPAGQTFVNWFKATLPELEKNPQLRNKNAIIAIQLLPLFEEHPSLWDSLNYWNKWEQEAGANIWVAFDKWVEILPSKNRASTKKLIALFGR